MKTCNDVINEGIPISEGVIIYYDDLLSISNDRVKTKRQIAEELKKIDIYANIIRQNSKKLSDKIDMDLDIGFAINIFADPLLKTFFISPQTYISNILTKLNVDNMGNYYKINGHLRKFIELEDLKKYEDEIVKQFTELIKVSTVNELEYKFPFIYNEYKIEEALLEEADRQRKKIKNKNLSEYDKKKLEKYFQYYIDYKGYNYNVKDLLCSSPTISVPEFCKNYGKKLAFIIDSINRIELYMKCIVIDFSDLDIDNDKFELYINYLRIIKAINTTSEKEKQNIANLVANYFQRNANKKYNNEIKIEIKNRENYSKKQEKITITPEILYKELKLLLKNNPTIKLLNLSTVDFSKMNLFEVQDFVEECLKDLQAYWEIIPDGVDIDIPPIGTGHGNNKIDPEKQLELFMKKKDFFAATDPFFRVKGVNTFKGYIGYIYKNGKVVLEKYYDNPKNHKLTKGAAIYTMNIEDFYRLSHYPRRIIIQMLKNDPSIGRFPHDSKENWKKEVEKIIYKDNDKSKTVEEVKELIRRKKMKEE